MGLTFDDARFPCVEVTWAGTITDGELTDFTLRMDGWFARGGPFSLLVDARDAAALTSAQRQALLAHMRQTAAQADGALVQAIVLDNAFLRAFYFGLLWAIPMGFPSKSFAEVEAARAWLVEQLRTRGGPKAKQVPR